MNSCKYVIGMLSLFFLAITGQATPVIDPLPAVTIPAGKSLILPVTATSPTGQPLTYTVTSSTAGIAVVMHTNNPFWQLTVAQAAATNAAGAYQTPYRGGLVTVTNVGTMTFMLFPEYAPHTVNVFQGLTMSGFFNSNTIFHRVVSNFVIQGGDPNTNGTGGLVFKYNDEFNPQAIFSGNGQLALANSGKNTDGSQFFVTEGPQRFLDFGYTIFGQLVRGFEVLTNIEGTVVDANSRPLADEIIQSASYVTNTADTVLTLTATNISGIKGTITVIADDGTGGRTTNVFNATTVTDASGDNQAFFHPNNIVTNLVAPVNTTLTNFVSATELNGDQLYWFPGFGDQTSADNGTNSSFNQSNSILKTLTYNVTNKDGQLQLFIKPATNYAGPINVTFDVSYNSQWNLYQQYGISLPAYAEQNFTFVFGDTTITGQPNPVSVLAKAPFASELLATFTNGVPGSDATNFTASINWGDDSVEPGTVVNASNGLKSVLGAHTYSQPGNYPVYTTISSTIGATATVLSFVNATNPVEPPSLTIVYPQAGQVVTNQYSNPATIAGIASDNGNIASVWYRVNSGGWQEAAGTNIWTASFTPVYGVTNIFQAYAVNGLNESSPVNTVLVKYLAGDILTLNPRGLGSISPNLNGDLLPLGTNYTLTATASNGFTFAGWTGSLVTNSSNLKFAMAPNFSVTATFLDQTRPALLVTNLVNGQRVGSNTFIVRGTASDNWPVAGVNYQLNNSGWTLANGTTNWSATLNLLPGTNIFRIYAADANGTSSSTNTLALDYTAPVPLQLQANGLGTFTPNDSNALLNVGQNYPLTATPASGFKFVSWTNGLSGSVSNGTALTFNMQSNLVLTATFADITRPTVQITNVPAGLTISNASFTVRGTASDNWLVTNVWVQLNSNGWTLAAGTNNWNIPLTLSPGTNTVRAYAVDNTGNLSITNSASIIFALTAPLTILTNGLGSLTPNDANQNLRIGQNYPLTGTPASGFKFISWTNGLTGAVSNNSTLVFNMQSNLVLTASFADITPPAVKLTNMPAGLTLSNASFIARGNASDNWLVSNVWVQLNSNNWTLAAGTTNWNIPLTLLPGTNSVRAYAVDNTGNLSATNSASVFFALTAPLTIVTNGLGSLTPSDANQNLRIGQNYPITATPGSGFKFVSWTNGLTGAVSNGAALIFNMQSNLVLTATFADITPPAVKITNMPASLTISNGSFTVRGTASDNWLVSNVWVQLNSNGWALAAGTTNWNTPLTLSPGTNMVRAYAVDNTGNLSTTNSATLFFALTAPLTILTNGLGSITPNDANLNLRIGQSYAISATPASGFKFVSWTNGLTGAVSNNPALVFTMQSNLVLTVNFADNQKPTNAIVVPAAGQTVNYPSVTVQGKAGDNVAVGEVWVRLNGGNWLPADTENGWTNWSALVMAGIGTNVLQALAMDSTGNLSTTNQIVFIYPFAIGGTWNITRLAAPAMVTLAGNVLTGGDEFDSETGQMVIATNFTFTGTLGNAFTGTLSLETNGLVDTTIMSDGGTNEYLLAINAAEDTMVLASSPTNSQENYQEMLIFHRAPATVSLAGMAGAWNAAQFTEPYQVIWNPSIGVSDETGIAAGSGILTPTAGNLTGGTDFGTNLGSLTLAANGKLSGNFGGAFTGNYTLGTNGLVKATIINTNGTNLATLFVNASLSSMMVGEAQSGTNDNKRTLDVFERQPAATTVAALAGGWNLIQYMTPAQLNWDPVPDLGGGFTGGDDFSAASGTMTVTANGSLTGTLGDPFSGSLAVATGGLINATIITSGSTNKFSLFLNSDHDTMTLVSGQFNSINNEQQVIIFVRAPQTP